MKTATTTMIGIKNEKKVELMLLQMLRLRAYVCPQLLLLPLPLLYCASSGCCLSAVASSALLLCCSTPLHAEDTGRRSFTTLHLLHLSSLLPHVAVDLHRYLY